MTDEVVSAAQFHAADGVEGWRVLYSGASAHWATTSLIQGAEFAVGVAVIAAETGRAPDLDLLPGTSW